VLGMGRVRSSPRFMKYNLKTERVEQSELPYIWTFFILNDLGKSRGIEENLLTYFGPCEDWKCRDTGVVVTKGSLHGRLITFKSRMGRMEDKTRIYGGDFRKDRDLRPLGEVAFYEHVQRMLSR